MDGNLCGNLKNSDESGLQGRRISNMESRRFLNFNSAIDGNLKNMLISTREYSGLICQNREFRDF